MTGRHVGPLHHGSWLRCMGCFVSSGACTIISDRRPSVKPFSLSIFRLIALGAFLFLMASELTLRTQAYTEEEMVHVHLTRNMRNDNDTCWPLPVIISVEDVMIKPASRQQAEAINTTAKNVRSTHSITCAICDAGYMPSQSRQDLLQAVPSVLESTFMSMCHYCFRCRRPACPQCWDAMHGVCGACVQEAHLPFRSSASPLTGILFPPSASSMSHISHMGQSSMETTITPLLICIRPGRFQQRTGTFETATAQESEDVLLPPIGTNIFKTIESVLNVILLSVLLFVLALILLAAFSAGANAQISQLFHVDIRAEMAYLLYAIRQMHV